MFEEGRGSLWRKVGASRQTSSTEPARLAAMLKPASGAVRLFVKPGEQRLNASQLQLWEVELLPCTELKMVPRPFFTLYELHATSESILKQHI